MRFLRIIGVVAYLACTVVSIQASDGPPSLTGYILVDSTLLGCDDVVVRQRSYAHPNGKLVQRRWSTAERDFVAQLAGDIAGRAVTRYWVSVFGDTQWVKLAAQVSGCELARSVHKVDIL